MFVLILRNNAYGGMKRDQMKNYGGRIIGTSYSSPTSQARRAYGAKGFAVTAKKS